MKKLSLLLLLALGANQLTADDAPFTYHMGLHFGENYADSSSKMRDNSLYGIRATVMMTPFYGLSIGYDRLEDIDVKDSTDSIDVQRYYMQIEVDGEEQYHTVPYITLTAGYEDLSKDIMAGNDEAGYKKYDVSQLYIGGGLGFRYNFIPELSLYAEGNAIYKTDTTDVDYTVLAGLQYHVNATTCDHTYITDRMREKPQEKTVLHVGAVNAQSGWKHTAVGAGRSATQKVARTQPAEQIVPVKTVHKPAHERTVHRTHRPKQKRSHLHTAATAGGYYVMMGAFKTKAGIDEMVAKLQKRHVSFVLRDSKRSGLTYVMAGAYPTKKSTARALRRLRRITPDAYIAKVK